MQKKLLSMITALIITLAMASTAGAEGIIKMGYDHLGTVETEYFNSYETSGVESGYAVGIELLKSGESRLQTGIGVEYQFMRNLNGDNQEIGFIPAYLTARLNLFKGDTSPYLQGRVGYNVFRVNEGVSNVAYNGGLFYGIGAGLSLAKDLQLKIDYAVHNGEKQWENVVTPHKYEKIGLSVGLVF